MIKVERAGEGDITRGQVRDIPDVDSLYFTILNHNKRSITIDAKHPKGKAVLPSMDNVINGSYEPLSRPIFIYVNEKAYERAEVKKVARELLARLKQLLVLNWRQKAAARSALSATRRTSSVSSATAFCAASALLSLLVAVPIGYLMSRGPFPGRSLLDAVLD